MTGARKKKKMECVARRCPTLCLLAVVGLTFATVSCSKCLVGENVTVLDARDGEYLVYRVSGTYAYSRTRVPPGAPELHKELIEDGSGNEAPAHHMAAVISAAAPT
jgi:hypothetical protein